MLEVASSDDLPGAKVIMYPCKDQLNDNQLWYEDMRGIIRSKLNGFALTAQAKPAAMAAIGGIFKGKYSPLPTIIKVNIAVS